MAHSLPRRPAAWPKVPPWIILAAVLGAMLLAGVMFSRDYRREQGYLEEIFLQRGEVLIHSLEMLGRVRFGDNGDEARLLALWNNLEDEANVLFMAITDEDGRPLAQVGYIAPGADVFKAPQPRAPGGARFLPNFRRVAIDGRGVYMVYRSVRPLPPRRMMRHMEHMGQGWDCGQPGGGRGWDCGWSGGGRSSRRSPPLSDDRAAPDRAMPGRPARYLWVGFDLTPFDQLSQSRVRTTAVFVGLFCLAGLAGVLALFWWHNSRLARQRLAALGSLAAGLAHEIRNPLGAIRGLTQHLLNKGPADSPDREALEVMLASVDRLAAAITDFLDYARPGEIKAAPLDLAKLVHRLAALAGHDARSRAVDLDLRLPDRPVIIEGDEARLSQAFLNLYLNAIEAAGNGREGGRLTVTLEANRHRAILTFRDNGPGFSPEQLARPFVPYFTTKAEGHGLGLALVEKTIRAHPGAEVSLAAPPEGGGLVTVSFPLEQFTNQIS